MVLDLLFALLGQHGPQLVPSGVMALTIHFAVMDFLSLLEEELHGVPFVLRTFFFSMELYFLEQRAAYPHGEPLSTML